MILLVSWRTWQPNMGGSNVEITKEFIGGDA